MRCFAACGSRRVTQVPRLYSWETRLITPPTHSGRSGDMGLARFLVHDGGYEASGRSQVKGDSEVL